MDTTTAISKAQRPGIVYLVRGWRDLYSTGIDQLADKLRNSGIRSEVYRDEQWKSLAAAISDRYHDKPVPGPLVLIGFSYGADDVLRISERLLSAHVQPDLLITIDPVTPPQVPANVRVCYNFFQTNGVWDIFPWLRGVPLTSAGAGAVINVDIRRAQPDLLEPGTSHSNIAANPGLHREIIEHVLKACGSQQDPRK